MLEKNGLKIIIDQEDKEDPFHVLHAKTGLFITSFPTLEGALYRCNEGEADEEYFDIKGAWPNQDQNEQMMKEIKHLLAMEGFDHVYEIWEQSNAKLKQAKDEAARMRDALIQAESFISRIMAFHGQGLIVHNWNQNGEGEPWDNFFDENMVGDELEVIRAALSGL